MDPPRNYLFHAQITTPNQSASTKSYRDSFPKTGHAASGPFQEFAASVVVHRNPVPAHLCLFGHVSDLESGLSRLVPRLEGCWKQPLRTTLLDESGESPSASSGSSCQPSRTLTPLEIIVVLTLGQLEQRKQGDASTVSATKCLPSITR